jgi:hypothetical protein
LWELAPLATRPADANGPFELQYSSGVREAIFREAIILSRKISHCVSVLAMLSEQGRNTWSSIVAYETAFYAAKSFCYLLGFASVDRSSKLFLDAFPETEVKIDRKKQKRFDTLLVHKFDDRLTHEVLWALARRLINTTVFDSELDAARAEVKDLDWSQFTWLRNKIHYDGAYWPLWDQLDACDLLAPALNDEFKAAASLEKACDLPFATDYFAAARLFKRMIHLMLNDLAQTAPVLRAEADGLR